MPNNAMLFIHALTGVHPGAGTALGVVDLPVQRERHTGWPIIPASSIKGVLRDTCDRGDKSLLFEAFGPEKVDENAFAGAVAFTDARILAFPVRSLKGVFAWVTCPAVLDRLVRDLKLADPDAKPFPVPAVEKEKVLVVDNSPVLLTDNKVVLEEFEFARSGKAEDVVAWVSARAVDDTTKKRMATNLVVLHDDDFTHFVRHATEVVARIGLDHETKTVKKGALFYQEFLPPETVMYSLVIPSDSRKKGGDKKAADLLTYIRENTPPSLQLGGDETIGRGICAVRWA